MAHDTQTAVLREKQIDLDGNTLVIQEVDAETAFVHEVNFDSGTDTADTSAATVNAAAGKVTSEGLTTAAAAAETLTITSDSCVATSLVFCSVANGTNTQGIPVIGEVAPGAGSFTVAVENQHASEAFNGTVVVSFVIVQA